MKIFTDAYIMQAQDLTVLMGSSADGTSSQRTLSILIGDQV
jgi:hypothetical protein